jgi:cytochrome c peroxidase
MQRKWIFVLVTGIAAGAQQPLRELPTDYRYGPKVYIGDTLPPDRVALGRRLFFDKRLSENGTVACATCHDPLKAFTDGKAASEGIHSQVGQRNTPTLVNRGAGEMHFWDGRASSLEQQALMPLQDPTEMGMKIDDILGRLRADAHYPAQFRAVFQHDPNSHDLAWALADYVRTIHSVESPFDRFMHGDDTALNALEKEGFRLFRDKANCTVCHGGADFTDEAVHNTGVAWRDGKIQDEGRFAVTGRSYHHGAFKTPTLREVPRTAPYMHDGSLKTLEEVVEFYDRGGNRNPWIDEQITPLHLSVFEKQAIVAFLKTLSGTVKEGPAH